jgi:hypothetical protein
MPPQVPLHRHVITDSKVAALARWEYLLQIYQFNIAAKGLMFPLRVPRQVRSRSPEITQCNTMAKPDKAGEGNF